MSLPPATEAARLAALRDLRLLDTPPHESFNRLTRMASKLFALPIGAVSLTDADRQWFKSRVGVDHWSIPREKAPCAQVAEDRRVLVIHDMLEDPCYRDSLLARSGVRFYAGAPLTTLDGHGLGAVCVLGTEPRQTSAEEIDALKDLAAMVMAQIELQHAFGRIDPISGLPNRIQFFDDLDDLASDFAGQRRSAVLLDLAGVEQINHVTRVLGPAAADEFVRQTARDLRAILGDDCLAYHVGPLQLAWLWPGRAADDPGHDLLDSGADVLRRLGGPAALGSAAVGVAPFALGALQASDVLRIAQGAGQDARSTDRRVALYSTDQDSAFQRRFQLVRDYAQAVTDFSALHLVYQPRVEAATGRCVGVEALLRWTHPTLGPIAPGEFIPLVEQSSLAGPTTAWVIASAADQLARWREDGLDLQVSVNISAANLRDPDFAASVVRVLAHKGVPTSALELEITETSIMHDTEQTRAQIEGLSAAGVRLAIDDFGTGYSSLSYLQRLPVQVIKIDRSFMADLDTDPRQLSLVAMMITMAKHLGYRVVAEGAETEGVVTRLRAAQCDEIQGYFFARPMTADALGGWLARHAAAA